MNIVCTQGVFTLHLQLLQCPFVLAKEKDVGKS